MKGLSWQTGRTVATAKAQKCKTHELRTDKSNHRQGDTRRLDPLPERETKNLTITTGFNRAEDKVKLKVNSLGDKITDRKLSIS
jgi:hypothetical protein